MYDSPSAGQRLLGALCAIVIIASCSAFVASNAVRSNLTREDYYEEAIDENDAYDRLFSELLVDPAFERQTEALLGGLDVPQEEIAGTLRLLVDEAYIREQARIALGQLFTYIERRDDTLELAVDVTPILDAVPDVSVDYLISAMDVIPVRQSGSLEDFELDLANLVDLVSGDGTLPSAIPNYPIPASSRLPVALILIEAGGLDLEDPADAPLIDDIGAAIAGGDVAGAIKISAASLISGLVANSTALLTANPYIERRTVDGEVRFYLRPPAVTRQRLERKLEPVRLVDSASSWLWPVSAATAFIASLFILLFSLPHLRSGLRWMGATWVVAAIVISAGWMIARPRFESESREIVVSQASSLPPSFQALGRDVATTAVGDLEPFIVLPSLLLAGAGAAIVILSLVVPRRRHEW